MNLILESSESSESYMKSKETLINRWNLLGSIEKCSRRQIDSHLLILLRLIGDYDIELHYRNLFTKESLGRLHNCAWCALS